MHVNKSNRIYNVSDRVIALDFVVDGKCIRSIAVYVPHCGYSAYHLEQTYEQLRCTVSEAYRKKRAVIIGGDFNTVVNVGIRGILLEQFVQEFSLCNTNGTIPENNEDWTFCSCMGIKRRLDYVLSSNCFVVKESGPSNILNLGSDHRDVRSVLTAQKRKTRQYVKKVQMKNWSTGIDARGNASKYQEELRKNLDHTFPANVETLNAALYDAATLTDIRRQAPGKGKPW